MALRQILIFLLTYWVASDLLSLLMLRIWQPRDASAGRDVFFLTRGLGPVAISWLLYHLVLFFPHRPGGFYVSAIAAVFAGVLFLGWRQLPLLADTYRGLARAIRRCWPPPPLAAGLFCVIAGIAVFILVIGVAFPIVDGDALGFAVEARLIYRDLSFAHYPTLSADAQTGYYYDTFQVPCLQMLSVWFYLLAGTSRVDVLPRTVAPMYAMYCVLLLGRVLWRRSRDVRAALWGGLALIAVPVFAAESYLNGQDAHRIYFSFCAVVLLETLLAARTVRQALLLAVFLGLTIYSHFFGLLTLLAALLLYLWLAEERAGRKMATAALIAVTALFVGAAHHYARPAVAQRVLWQFPALARYLDAVLTRLGMARVAAVPDLQSVYDWMAARRGQESWVQHLVFGKLQALTGFEWFGLSVWVFLGAVWLWVRQPQRVRLDRIVLGTAVVYAAVVLSDVRVMATSNPRYIGTALPLCAYFTGLEAPTILRAAQRRWGAAGHRLAALLAVSVLVLPLVATTAVRGAKVGITNPGNVLEKLHSVGWVGAVVRHPLTAVQTLWEHYLGIRDTMQYLAASDDTKLRHAHNIFATVQYMNASTPPDATALVFRVTPYFYYARRKGVSYIDPRMEAFAQLRDTGQACSFLTALGIDHVLIDSYYKTYPLYKDTSLQVMLADPRLSTMVYEYGSAQVYKLQCAQ